MGLEKEEGFVCSECGADVPAEAKACPKCGEKFD
jgi:ribosomal protein L40E